MSVLRDCASTRHSLEGALVSDHSSAAAERLQALRSDIHRLEDDESATRQKTRSARS